MQIKVFIIDDSILVRNSIKKLLKNEKDIVIIGEAPNPVDAFEEFSKVGLPDVFLLDIEMPKMDGLTFLKQIQEQKPIPTVMCSTLVTKGSTTAIRAMELGACDIILKPKNLINAFEDDEIIDEFVSKIKAAYRSKNINTTQQSQLKIDTKLKTTHKIVAIGASTGGVQTLQKILGELQENHPPIVIVQHMPIGFTQSFATRLDKLCVNSKVQEATDKMMLEHGTIIIAPGDKHLEVEHIGMYKYQAVLKDYPKVSNHKPSVDVLFTSVAKEVKIDAVAFILTGMGKDGAMGIKKIKEAGGTTYAQDEKSSIVYGMPKVAFELGAIDKQVSLDEISDIINKIGR